MDSHMLFGCSGFVFTSFATYFLFIWPFFVWFDIHRWGPLGWALGMGVPFAFVCGAISSAKFELAGAAGFVGGMVASSIFLFLRFEQVFLEAQAQRIPFPPYPGWIRWFAPAMLLASSLLMSATVLVIKANREGKAKETVS